MDAARSVLGVSAVWVLTSSPASSDPKIVGGKVLIDVTLTEAADSAAAKTAVQTLRTAVHAMPGAHALVGGTTATDLDTQASSAHDLILIIPLVEGRQKVDQDRATLAIHALICSRAGAGLPLDAASRLG